MLSDLESKAAAGEPFSRAEAERVLTCPDLVSVGCLAECARIARHGDVVTYAPVLTVDTETAPADVGVGREIRIVARPRSIDDACSMVRAVVAASGGVPVTGFSAVDLLALVGGDHLVLADASRRLSDAGLVAVAFFPVDRCDAPAEVIRALHHGGLQVWRATVDRADTLQERVACIERVAALQLEHSVFRAFSPLPRFGEDDTPSTGYDDVRTIAVARLVCAHVPSIQVDWGLCGPKLAQVAIAFGADDIDNAPAVDSLGLGPRRSPSVDIARQIAAAFATPKVRDGRFESVP